MMPSMLHAGVYGAVRHYLKASPRPAPTTPTRSPPRCARSRSRTRSRERAIRADGRVARAMYLARVKKPADFKDPWDYFEIVRTIAPEETVWPLSESKCPLVKNAAR